MPKITLSKSLKIQPALYVIITVGIISCLSTPLPLQAFEKRLEIKVPEAVISGLQHLLDLADPTKKVSFKPHAVTAVLEFVESSKKKDALYYCNIIQGLTSAYHDFDIQLDFKTMVDYVFNPDIPGVAIAPTSTRIHNWTDSEKSLNSQPQVAQFLESNDGPMVFRGRQFIEVTPDLTSGAYYQYHLYLTLMHFKYRQRHIIMTINKQLDLSSVGKKGYVLGSDSDWDYLYTGKTGLTVPALGWVKSYMYDSQGINIYDSIDPTEPRVRCAVFKWLRAGWSGINMVQKKHIFRGLKRFATTYKEILESPKIPSAEKLAADFARIRGLPLNALQSKMPIYFDILKNRYISNGLHSNKRLADLLRNNHFQYQMTKDEMEAAMFVEYMKRALGKIRPGEVEELLSLKP